jgi:hypothetical protein
VQVAVLGSTRERRMRAARVLPEADGPWRIRKGKGPEGRKAQRSQERQEIQEGRSGRLRQERRMARAGAGSACTGSGRGRVEMEVWKRALSPPVTSQ